MPLEIDLASPSRGKEILQLLCERHFYYSPLRDITEDQVRAWQEKRLNVILEQAKNGNEVTVLSADSGSALEGYLVLFLGAEDEISGTGHALIADMYCRDRDMLRLMIARAAEYAASFGHRYLAAHCPVGDELSRQACAELGFIDEYEEFVVKIRPVSLGRSDFFTIERAQQRDMEEIIELGVRNVRSLLSPCRGATVGEAERYFLRNVESLPRTVLGDPDYAVALARLMATGRIIGFIFLNMKEEPGEIFARTTIDDTTGMSQGYFNYISVKREYWGKYVAQRLTDHGAQIFASRGFRYFAGEILSLNLNALEALRRLYTPCFDVEKVRKVKILSPENGGHRR